MSLLEWSLDAADLVEKSEAEDGSFAAHPRVAPHFGGGRVLMCWQAGAKSPCHHPFASSPGSGARLSPRRGASERGRAATLDARAERPILLGAVGVAVRFPALLKFRCTSAGCLACRLNQRNGETSFSSRDGGDVVAQLKAAQLATDECSGGQASAINPAPASTTTRETCQRPSRQ